jgi:hypothetical protein
MPSKVSGGFAVIALMTWGCDRAMRSSFAAAEGFTFNSRAMLPELASGCS